MTQKFGPAEHPGNFADGFNLHFGAGATAVTGVIVGIDLHGQRIRGAGHGVRRFQHLPGIEGVEIGIIVAQPDCGSLQDCCHRMEIVSRNKFRECWKILLEQLSGAGEKGRDRIVRHGKLSPLTVDRDMLRT